MISKVLIIFLLSIAFTFAKIPGLEDSSQDSTISVELSNIYENKYNPFNILFLGGVGVTSTKRIEIDIVQMSALNVGSKLFNLDRLLTDQTIFRIDIRLDKTEDNKTISDISIGSAVLNTVLGFTGMAIPEKSFFSNIILGGLWFSSGTTKLILWGNNVSGVSLAESHAFEWFLHQTTYDNKTHYSFKEFGFIEEVGIQFGIMFAQATAGVSFEITNKQRNIGCFLKLVTLPIPVDHFPRTNEQTKE